MELHPDDIAEILRIFAASDLEELRLDVGATSLHVSKRGGGSSAPLEPPARAVPIPEAAAAPIADVVPAPTLPAAPVADAETSGLLELRSPLLGVFFRRPAPDQPAFIEIGQAVSPEDPVCIIDVMKLFTRIPAGLAGTLVEICVEDGALVEHGQVLMRFQPA